VSEIQSDASNKHENPQEVPFDGGCLGCLFVLIVMVAAVSLIAAFDSGFVASLANNESRRNVFAAIAPMRLGSINVGALVLAGLLGWEATKLARRFVDTRAVWLDGDMIRFHPTVRHRPLPLLALEQITHKAGDIESTLVLEHSGGACIKIHAVDHEVASNFVATAQRAKAALTFD
jgi:hypothetical protein